LDTGATLIDPIPIRLLPGESVSHILTVPTNGFAVMIVDFFADADGAPGLIQATFFDAAEVGPVDPDEPIPTVSEWGLVVLVLALLVLGKLYFGRRTRRA